MGNLRQDLIRLAHQVPSLRKHLVPILVQSAGKYLHVFHGTSSSKADDIQRVGLVSPIGYDRAQWYMVAEDWESAAFHGDREQGRLVVFEFRVPTEPKVFPDGYERHMWEGFPYLWKGHNLLWGGESTRWWALRQPLPPEFIVRRTHVSPDKGK